MTARTPFIYALSAQTPLEVFAALQAMPYSLFFDSALSEHDAGKFSVICFLPVETIEAKDNKVTVTNRDQQLSFRTNPFHVLRDRLELYGRNTQNNAGLPAFQGGAAGMFGYDLARSIERLPSLAEENPGLPDMAVGLYNQCVCFDHDKNQAWHIIHARDEQEAETLRAQFLKLLERAPGVPEFRLGDSEWSANMGRSLYKSKLEKILAYIKAGDIFQANFSQRFSAELPEGFDPFAHYGILRRVNPAPFASYMNFGDVIISSASPERFVKVHQRAVETRPIKGTRPRTGEEASDQLFRNQLENSEKDRAENAMIVDLLRNDLSKVCEDHSVNVPSLFNLESYSSVHHMVSTVTGSLRADKSPVDLLEACFPGGSVTGCPKVRAMEIIEEMEQNRRGPYCGALGYIGFNGNMDMSITIRTLVYQGNSVSFQTGGGIVADSDPEAEYQETFDKAEGIFRSFEVEKEVEEVEKFERANETGPAPLKETAS